MKEPILERECKCGVLMFQVLTYETPDKHATRCGWFCAKCRAWCGAKGRERKVERKLLNESSNQL